MPRPTREATHVPGVLVHVISRFVDGRFVMDDEARAQYLCLLGRALCATDWSLISYALMSSHLHLGLVMGEMELRSWALSLHVRFAQWINRRQRATNPKALGHVFADRPSTKVVCPTRARLLVAYHHRNPIAAGVVMDARESSWTSHRAYLSLDPCMGGLDVTLGLRLAGFSRSLEGRLQLHELVQRTGVDSTDVWPIDASTPDPCLRRTPPGSSDAHDLVRLAADLVEERMLPGSPRRITATVRRVALLAGLERGLTARAMATALRISPSGASRLLTREHDARAVRAMADRVNALANESAGGQFVNLASPEDVDVNSSTSRPLGRAQGA